MSRGRGRPALGRRALIGAGVLVAAGWMVATPSAWAFVQYQIVDNGVGTGVLFHWNQGCVPVVAFPKDLSDMPADEIDGAATAAAAAWSRDMLPCTFMDLKVGVSLGTTIPARSDAYNVLVFRDPWCDPNQPDMCQPEALAVTSVWAGKTSGVIHDGDIEVNAENFVWADLVLHPAAGKQDLQNALTHEMGHLIGLDHNCYTPSVDPLHQTDNNGDLVPLCLGAPADVQDATMYTKADLGDLSKRTLAPDDQLGVCSIYPVAQDPNYCPPPGGPPTPGCGCSLTPTLRWSRRATPEPSSPMSSLASWNEASAGLIVTLGLALVGVTRAGRRRRRDRRAGRTPRRTPPAG